MSAHTPGPWRTGSEGQTEYGVFAVDLTARIICYTGTSTATRTPESRANARLIACAPDLLERLKQRMREHQPVENHAGCPCRHCEDDRLLIAKAEGE